MSRKETDEIGGGGHVNSRSRVCLESIFDGETQVKALIVWFCCRGRTGHFSGFENGSGNGSRGTIPIEKMAENAVWAKNRNLTKDNYLVGPTRN